MKRKIPVFLFVVLVAVFIGWVPNVHAFSNFGANGTNNNCQLCHKIFGSGPGDAEHDAHAAAGGNCSVCHGGFPPALTNCTKCHGRTQDGGGDSISAGLGRGLRQHHQGAGISTCAGCHSDATGPKGVGENVPPSFYPGPLNLNPCNGSEERFASLTISLDNDGDGLTDGADPDCQPAAPKITVSPTSKDYGNVTVGNSSGQVFTVKNTGTANLVVSGMTLSDTTNFSLDTGVGSKPCGATPTIVAADNCTVSVAFTPKSVASFSKTLSIASNDAVSPTLVPLTGSGVAVPTPTFSVSPASIAFGQVIVAGSSSRVVTLSNTGSGALVVSGITLTDTTNFSLNTAGGPKSCGSATPTIAAADNCTVSVAFSPKSVGSFNDNLSIASNDTANPTVPVPLSGSGVAAAPNIAVSPASIDFSGVDVGTPATRVVTISNTGTAVLNVSGIILSDNTVIHTLDLGGGPKPCITATPIPMSATLNGAQAGTTSTGTGSASITYNRSTNLLSWNITYSGLSGPPTVAHFHGPARPGVSAGVQVPITVSASPLVGSAPITEEKEADLLAGLYYVNIHTAANPAGEIRGQVTVPVTVPAVDNCTVAVTFTPPAAGGPFPATLTVTSDDSDTPSTTVSITGSGVTPSSGGGGGGGCSVIGSGSNWEGGAVLFLTLLAILVTLRRQRAKARR